MLHKPKKYHIMKKLFTLLFALLATTCLWAYDFQVGDLYYTFSHSYYDGPYSVAVTYQEYGSADNYAGLTTITIPETVTYNDTTYNVTRIGSNAFNGCSSLTSITIPNSVTRIDGRAFKGCSSLTSITIPNSVTMIWNNAFEGCSSLISVTIGSSITYLDPDLFLDCSSLSSIVWNAKNYPDFKGEYSFEDILFIENDPFNGISSQITTFIIGDSVEHIPDGLGAGMDQLTHVTIGNNVTSIGENAFVYTYNLELVTLTAPTIEAYCRGHIMQLLHNTWLGEGLAKSIVINNQEITELLIPNTVDSIHHYAFQDCSSLTSVTIPNSVTSIGERAFKGCSGLTSVTIGNSVTSIGYRAFSWCSSLTSIESLAEVPPTLGSFAFYNVSTTIPVYVPCGTVSAYQSSDWKAFTNIQEPLAEHSIAVGVNDSIMGTAKVDENTRCGAHITATANYGYHFTQWSDGNTDNPRTLVLTQDTALTAEFAINQYNITTTSSHAECGTTQGDTTVNYLEYTTISATANYGYHFTQWNDGNTDNPRVVKVTGDKTYTAYFDKNTYSITKQYDAEQGSITGPTSGKYLDVITLTATPKTGYHFTQWSDGVKDNPRTLVLTQDTTFTAEFVQLFSGQCGDDLYWDYDEDSKKISITGSGDMYDYTKSTQPWLLFQEQITEVTTSNTTTSIGTSAFEGCIRLGKVSLGYAMENIAANAFAECKRLYDIYVYASYPPFAEESSFANYNVYLYVPCKNQRDYILDVVWGEFKFIECLGAEPDDTGGDDVTVTPGTNDVTITWPTEDEAETYSIVITKDGEVFCTLTFNKDGQLLNIAFAPGRDGNRPAQYAEQVANGGYRFTVTGLKEGTNYDYTITTKDSSDQTISTYSGEFTTKSNVATDIDNVTSTTNCQKLFRDGQLLIIRDGKTYNAQGMEL